MEINEFKFPVSCSYNITLEGSSTAYCTCLVLLLLQYCVIGRAVQVLRYNYRKVSINTRIVFFIKSRPCDWPAGSRPAPPAKVGRCCIGGPGAPLKHR
jgi:hypothetical protein